MIQEEVLQYNKRCAEFLGFEISENKECFKLPNKNGWIILDVFYSDWNWIMKVIEAIENKSKYTILNKDLYSSFDIGNNHIKFYFSPNNKYLLQLELQQFLPDEPWIHTMYKHHIIKQFDFKKHGRKEAVVEAINQFLIWYNNEKVQTN